MVTMVTPLLGTNGDKEQEEDRLVFIAEREHGHSSHLQLRARCDMEMEPEKVGSCTPRNPPCSHLSADNCSSWADETRLRMILSTHFRFENHSRNWRTVSARRL